MRIKRIELCGFKSFCDKTTLDLNQPITGVVGPNGCGKSNIVDALRWAMGELSARHLRGRLMEDVIFNGSDTRGPSGFAEVSLTFENDGRVPPEYMTYEEITVTRRLHRDGTSEYVINRLPVRLRDITNLFLGTGVGTKAYAIIEQGRVGLIVSAKPEDRRHFIDEAAGITKYWRRRQAAERKMEATRQNLLRVSDVLDEIGSRLGTLRRQAKKAARYKEYRAEMRDVELWAASHQLLELLAEAKVVDALLAELEAERADAQLGLDRGEAQLEAARLEAADKERQTTALQETLYQLDNRIKLAENAVDFHAHEADQLEEQAREAHAEVADLTRQLAEADAEREEVLQRLEEAGSARQELGAELRVRTDVLAGLRQDAADVEDAMERERQQAAEAERAAARAEANLRALSQRHGDLEERRERRRQEEARVLERLAELQATAEHLDGHLGTLRLTREQLERRREELSARAVDLEEAAQRGETQLEVLRTELHRRRSRLASLEEIQRRYEGFSRGTRAIMQRVNGRAQDLGVLGLVADILEAPPAYETALEAVLDQRLGTVIVEKEDVGIEAIAYLKQHSEGRSSFISRRSDRVPSLLERAEVGVVWECGATATAADSPSAMAAAASAVPSGPGVHGSILHLVRCKGDFARVADTLLGDVVVVDSLDHGLAAWETLPDKTLVTLDGEILEPSGVVTGGSVDAELSGVLRQKREIKELTEIIEKLEGDYKQTLDGHISVKTEIARLQQALDETTRDGHHGEKEILTHEKDLGRISSEIESLVTRQRELDAEFELITNQLDELARSQQEQSDEIARATTERRLCEDTAALLARERARLATLVEDAAAAVTDGKVALAQAETACQTVEERLQRIDQLRAERRERIERYSTGAATAERRAAELREKVTKLKEELVDMVGERAGVQGHLEAARTAYEEQAARAAELEGDLKELRARVAKLVESRNEQQLHASEQRMRRQHLEDQVWERYRERLAAVAGDYHLRPPVGDKELAQLDRLRQLIDRMGEINLTAIEEYEELNERFEYLKSHKDDLENALAQLQRAIQKINRTCRKRFKDTFEQVNAKFQEVFPRLFAGGRAKLVLTDPDGDVLKGGVDIVAQPPGKKLQSIEMMSGGEKALTAVSMIFAMFLVTPSPFSLLDEVDAPLDEANVVRFREMVREMSQTSQFIVITHNRRSMEIADKLYGVTMEEPGVSKTVSVNLNQFEG